MPLGAVIPVVVPFLAVAVLFYLRYLYGDSVFGLPGFGHDLNDREDTRVLKLNLRISTDKHPGDSSSRPPGSVVS